MTHAAMLAALLASSPAATPLQVLVEDSAVAKAVAVGLARELPEATVVRHGADANLRVQAMPDGAVLAISVTTRGGVVLLSRRIPLDPKAPQPALRLAILLVAETARTFAEASAGRGTSAGGPPEGTATAPPTVDTATAAPPATATAPPTAAATAAPGLPAGTPPPTPTPAIAPTPPPGPPLAPATETVAAAPAPARTATASAPRWLVLRAGLTVGGWLRPATPLVGFFGGVGVRFDRFSASARAEVAGLICCRLSDARFDGRALEAAFLAEARLPLVRWGPVDLAAAVAAGVAYVRVEGRPDDDPSFPVTLAEQTRSTWDPQARLALGVQWPLWPDGLALGLWAGVQLRAARLVVDLPARDGAPPPVDAGLVLPWFGLAASLPTL